MNMHCNVFVMHSIIAGLLRKNRYCVLAHVWVD